MNDKPDSDHPRLAITPGAIVRTSAGKRLAIVKGQDSSRWTDTYHAVLRAPWWLFFFGLAAFFCFINVVEHSKLDRIEPVVRSLDSEPQLKDQYLAWSTSRSAFNQKLNERDPEALKESWQRFYFKGQPPERGGPAPAQHINKRRLKRPEPESGA